MSKLEAVLHELNVMEQSHNKNSTLQHIDTRAKLLVTLMFLLSVLSVSIYNLSAIILHAIYPIILCSFVQISYITTFKKSLIALPFVLFIGIFNPIYDTSPLITIGNTTISAGWISFISIVMRGLISVQAVIILLMSSGFNDISHAMNRLGVPSLLSTQLLFAYRYIFVLLNEALNMHRARISRSYGMKNYSFRMWGIFIGQLFLRAIEHSKAINQAMLSRGFNGQIPTTRQHTWNRHDSYFIITWSFLFIFIHILLYKNIL